MANARQNMQRKMGVFTGDMSGTGTSTSRIFGAGEIDVIQSEKDMINRVFKIVDRDNSGTIDARELEDMFEVFDQNTSVLKGALDRILTNTDRNADGLITPAEFIELLTDRFTEDDVLNKEDEVKRVFEKMISNRYSKQEPSDPDPPVITVDSLHDISKKLGESVSKQDISGMIEMMNENFNPDPEFKKEKDQKDETDKEARKSVPAGTATNTLAQQPVLSKRWKVLTWDTFKEVMKAPLEDPGKAKAQPARASQWDASSPRPPAL